MSAYYNDSNPNSAAWLRELIADGLNSIVAQVAARFIRAAMEAM